MRWRYLTRGMAALGLVEPTLSFAAIDAVRTLAGSCALAPDFLAKRLMITWPCHPHSSGWGYRPNNRLLPPGCLPRPQAPLRHDGLAATIAFAFLLAVSGDPRTGFSVVQPSSSRNCLAAWLTAMTLIRLICGLTGLRAAPARRILLSGMHGRLGISVPDLRSRRAQAFDPVVFNAPEISWPLLRQHRIWGVVVASEPDSSAVETLLDCKLRGTTISSAAAFHENYLGRIDLAVLTANDGC